jgi:quinol monooxygenase YgiN
MTRRVFAALLAAALITVASPVALAEDDPILAAAKKALKEPTKPFAMWVSAAVKPGQEKAFEAAFAACRKETRKEKGNVAYELNADPEKPGSYALYEKWAGLDALDAHVKAEHTKKLLAFLADKLEAPPAIKFYAVAGE